MPEFQGFPGIGKATALPNLFFAAVLPRLETPGALLAFLWVSRLAQERPAGERFASAEDIWAQPAARASFEAIGGGRQGLDGGLAECLALGALLAVELADERGAVEVVHCVHDPASKRWIEQAQAGRVASLGSTRAMLIEAPENRPGVFTLYEELIGTITPSVADRLVEAEADYSWDLLRAAFMEARSRNIRNWRYIEAMLKNWKREGREDEAAGSDSFESRKQRYLGGDWGHIVNSPR